MQNKEINQEFAAINVPVELLNEAKICDFDVLEFYVDGNKIIIQKAECDSLVCNEDCQNCPCNCCEVRNE